MEKGSNEGKQQVGAAVLKIVPNLGSTVVGGLKPGLFLEQVSENFQSKKSDLSDALLVTGQKREG